MRNWQQKPIFVSLSPNVEKDDILLALKLIFQPWKWKRSEAPETCSRNIEREFRDFLDVKYAFAFNSGRSALMAILESLNLEKGSEVLIQAFTCNAAVNPISWSGLKPVFVEIERETLNIDPQDLKKKITPKSRVVMVQHTFGLPAKMNEILEVCREHNLILIEDCAHSLGAKYRGQKIGTFGRASFFSFGRDKVISSVYGGIAVTSDEELAEKINQFQKNCLYPSRAWIFQQLLHPVLTKLIIMPLYRFGELGRAKLLALQKLKILSKAVSQKEKKGKKPHYLPRKMPEALAWLALHQFKKLQKFNHHRQRIAKFYDQQISRARFLLPFSAPGRIYMRYPLLVKEGNTDVILGKARRQKIFLDNGWRKTPIVPPDTDLKKMQYREGSCPQAERVAQEILNLPTHINVSFQDAKRIAGFLKQN